MDSQEILFSNLKAQLKACAFKVSNGADPGEVHDMLIESIVSLDQLQSSLRGTTSSPSKGTSISDTAEIRKVARRLKLWADRRNQINARILIAFLTLKRAGHTTITEAALSNETNDPTFSSNFNQMKISADRNHGKVFEQRDDVIEIWGPVNTYVKEFEEAVFKD